MAIRNVTSTNARPGPISARLRRAAFGLVTLAAVSAGAVGAAQQATASASTSSGPTLVQSAGAAETASSTSLSATLPSASTAGDLLVLAASLGTGTTNHITSVTDSAGGVWTRIGAWAVSASNSDGELWYSANAASVTQVRATTKSATVMALRVMEFRGLQPTGTLLGSVGTAASSTTPSSGTATSADAALAVGLIGGHSSTQAITVTSTGYTSAGPQVTSRASSSAITSVVTGFQVLPAPGQTAYTGSLASAKYWAAGVALFKPVPPPNLFQVAVPGTVTAVAGRSTSLTVSTAVSSGQPQQVALAVGGLPNGVSATLTPNSVTAGQSATLTLSPTLSAVPGTWPVTVTGTGPTDTSSAAVALTVTAPPKIRAAFYYPWFPQTWGSDLTKPHTNYVVTRGLYSTDLSTAGAHVADLRYAGVSLGIASWFGQGTTTDKNWPVIMQAAAGTGLSWAPYYEAEGTTDPTVTQLVADLHYLRTTYGGPGSALAVLPGKGMPVFVYNADDTTAAHGCATVSRWKQAKDQLLAQYGEQVDVDLKVFAQYRTCADTPSIDGWHQYGPASAVQDFSTAPGQGAYSISPGYWKWTDTYADPTKPFLARDRTRWQTDIASMNASTAYWQLVTTYNEWGEGTAVESSSGCRSAAPSGTYCDWSGGVGGTGSDLITDLHNAPPF